MLAGRKYLGIETDVWSLGIILYILLCGGLPFDDDDENVMKELIKKGEYEEPEWLSTGEESSLASLQNELIAIVEACSLIRDMLNQDPAKRPTIEGMLTHPWFQLTIYDNLHENTPQPDSQAPRLSPNPTSPLANEPYFSEPFTNPQSYSSKHLSPHPSFSAPSPRTQEPPSGNVGPAPASELHAGSETSDPSEFHDSESNKPSSGVTTPTTIEEGEPAENKAIERPHSGEFSQVEKRLELLHLNESQSTIRRPSASIESSSIGGSSSKIRLAAKGNLEGQQEEDESAISDSQAPTDEHALHLPVALHSRTPSRTKRRSVSSTMSLERKHSYQNQSNQYHTYRAEGYVAQLSLKTPEPFSTPSEKHLLNQLSEMGFDTGQLVHSVISDACDASAATWWILRQKQVERGETDEIIQAREASAARRRERAAAYMREERRKAKAAKESGPQKEGDQSVLDQSVTFNESPVAIPPTPSFTFVDLGPPVSSSALALPYTQALTSSPEKSSLHHLSPAVSPERLSTTSPMEVTKPLPIPPSQALLREGSKAKTSPTAPQTPPRERRPELATSPSESSKGDRSGKTRSPSFSMLQRATSAFVGSGKKDDKEKEKQAATDIVRSHSASASSDQKDKRLHSPSKLIKPFPKPTMTHSDSSTTLLSASIRSPSIASSSPANRSPELLVLPQKDPMESTKPHINTSGASPMSPVSSVDKNARAGPGPSTMENLSSSESIGKMSKSKKDSLWNSFRYLFNEDKRRRKRDRASFDAVLNLAAGHQEVKVSPAIVLSRGIAARQPHSTRLAATPVLGTKRASMDVGRPTYSRRTSSVNSRRSSATSIHLPSDFAHNLYRTQSRSSNGQGHHATEIHPPAHRRSSERSHGSHTPTSDREFGSSRPSSSQSLSQTQSSVTATQANPSSRRPSGVAGGQMRSPSLQSDASGRFRSSAPASPLHNYHRRATAGSASTRVRHIKVIHESQILRSSSGASSLRSNASSRASSPERRRDNHDSDYDTGREDASQPMFRHRSSDKVVHHHHGLVNQIHRTRSPLAHPHQTHNKHVGGSALRPKQPLRDVFQHKDDDWVSDDAEDVPRKAKFAGGLGQSSGRPSHKDYSGASISVAAGKWVNGNRITAAHHPAAVGHAGRRVSKGKDRRGSSGRSSDEDDRHNGTGGSAGIGLGVFPPGNTAVQGGYTSTNRSGKSEKESHPSSVDTGRSKRQGLPSARAVVPRVVEEEEEEEET